MSWFDLIISQKPIFDSQQFISNTLTGSIVGEIAVDKLLEPSSLFRRIKTTASSFFIDNMGGLLESTSRNFSAKVLHRVVEHKTFPDLFPELFDRFHLLAHSDETDETISPLDDDRFHLSETGIQQLVHILFDNYSMSDPDVMAECLKASLISQAAFNDFVKKALVESLTPVCETAVHSSLIDLVRQGAHFGINRSIKKIISISTVPLIYSVALSFFAYQKIGLDSPFINAVKHLPSTSTVLWISTALHIAQSLILFWHYVKRHPPRIDINKEEVKECVFKLSRGPIEQSLKANRLFALLQIDPEASKIDALAKLLVDEAVDFFWEDLHRIKFLWLPLVT